MRAKDAVGRFGEDVAARHLARAVLVGIVALAFVLWLVATSDFGANRRTLAESQGVTLPPPPSQMQQQ